jgi:hypothetical protein
LAPLLIAHALAYPVALLSALACMPLAIIVRRRALLDASPRDPTHPIIRDVARDLSLTAVEGAQVQLVLEVVLGAALLVLVLVHLAALPWAAAETRASAGGLDTARGRRVFVYCFALLGAGMLLLGAASWLWLLVVPATSAANYGRGSFVMACVSRAPSKPNCTPKPPALVQRTTAGNRASRPRPGSSHTMVIGVPNAGLVSSASMNMPPTLMSLALPEIAGWPASSQVTGMRSGERGCTRFSSTAGPRGLSGVRRLAMLPAEPYY